MFKQDRKRQQIETLGAAMGPGVMDWALGTWSWRLSDDSPSSWACPEGWEGLSVLG